MQAAPKRGRQGSNVGRRRPYARPHAPSSARAPRPSRSTVERDTPNASLFVLQLAEHLPRGDAGLPRRGGLQRAEHHAELHDLVLELSQVGAAEGRDGADGRAIELHAWLMGRWFVGTTLRYFAA